ncbi:MAG: TolC family protein [Planctomycetales bacterium]|nr:TolC family protein [Planctomycetales bacterium]
MSLLRSWPLLCVVLLPAWQAAASIGGSPGIVKPLPKVDPPIECRPPVKVDLVAQEAVPAVGEPALTLGDLQQLALAHHPAIGRADALLDAAHGRWVQAGLRKNPVAGYEATDIGEGGSAGKQGGFVSQEFVTAHKRQLAREVVQRAIEQRQHEREVVRRRVLGDVQARYLEAVFAQREFDLLSQLGTLTAREVQLLERLREAQEASTLDVLAVQRVHHGVQLRRQQAEFRRLTSWRKLAAVVGVPHLARTTLALPPADRVAPDWDAVRARLLAESPQLAAAIAARQRAGWQLELEYARRRPNYEVTAGVQNDTLVQETLANVAIGVPLPLFDRNQGAICEAEAQVAAADSDVDRLQMQLQQQLAVAFGAWLDAHRRTEYYDQHILPNLEESVKLVERAFQEKQLDFLTVVRTQRELIRTRLDQLAAQEQAQAALAQLDNLLLSGSLELAEPSTVPSLRD